MKRKIAKVCVAAISMSMLSVVSVFASQTRYVEYENCPFSYSYRDSYNMLHSINGTDSVKAVVGWDEGDYGWIISALFPKPSVTIDGNTVDVGYVNTTIITGSSAYQEFSINNSSHRIQPTIYCDEYGETIFWTKNW